MGGVGAACREVALIENASDADHVLYGHALGDAADDFDPGIRGFEDGVGAERRGHEDHGGFCAGGLDGLVDGVEYGQVVVVSLAALARA